jgi:DNA-binding MarR family transcriptional regulator
MSDTGNAKLNEALRLYRLLTTTIQKSAMSVWLDVDLPIVQMRVLLLLSNPQAPITIGKLAEELHIGLPAASRLVERLIKEDLVIRTEDPTDRRRTLVQLSNRGKTIVENVGAVMHDNVQLLLRELTEDDLDALLRGFRALEVVIRHHTPIYSC